jgi:acetyl-CoA carboxylase carboxyltransferase component
MATTDDRADSTQDKLDQLQQLRDEASTPRASRRRTPAPAGKLLARERLVELLDPARSSSSTATCATASRTSGCSSGALRRRGRHRLRTIFGRKVFVFSQDFTVFGGSLSEVFAEKICKVMDLALKYGCP